MDAADAGTALGLEGQATRAWPTVEPGSWIRLDYPGVAHPVFLPDDQTFLASLGAVVRGWHPRIGSADAGPAGHGAHSCILPDGRDYTLYSTHIDEPFAALPMASAICAVVADLAQSFIQQRSDGLTLHCGALSFGAGVIALAGSARAGKSTLMARLSAEPDAHIFCDDMLPVTADGQAMALGIAPRLRLPLPDAASPGFRAHVRAHPGPADDDYGYVIAPTIAEHGTVLPLRVLLLLDRRDRGPARLHRLNPGEAERGLLDHSMNGFAGPAAALDMVQRLASGLVSARLVYSDIEDAVRLIRAAFGPQASGDMRLEPPIAPQADQVAAALPGTRFRRAGAARSRRSPEGVFLWQPGDAGLWHLNPMAEAVWTMLEIPGSARDLAQVLDDAWPEVPPERLLADICGLLGQLAEAGLVVAQE